MSKNVVEPGRLQTIWRMRVAYWINKATRAQAHARASAPTPTHTQTHALTRPPTHTHTHTHTHKATCNTYCFSTEQRLRERAYYVICTLSVLLLMVWHVSVLFSHHQGSIQYVMMVTVWILTITIMDL